MEPLLRRYTELPYLIDYLWTKELVLLNPATWDDRNDSFYIEEYARQSSMKSAYALCLTNSEETYHHWRVFSAGSGGVCIVFKREAFIAAINKVDGLRSGDVIYKKIKQLKENQPTLDELPFLKRHAFKHEAEYRLFYYSENGVLPIHRIPVPLSCIDHVVLSPWLAQSVVVHLRKTLKSISKPLDIRVHKSTLVENEDWKKFAN